MYIREINRSFNGNYIFDYKGENIMMRELSTEQREDMSNEKMNVLIHMCRALKNGEIGIESVREQILSIHKDQLDLIDLLDEQVVHKNEPKAIQIASFVNGGSR